MGKAFLKAVGSRMEKGFNWSNPHFVFLSASFSQSTALSCLVFLLFF